MSTHQFEVQIPEYGSGCGRKWIDEELYPLEHHQCMEKVVDISICHFTLVRKKLRKKTYQFFPESK